ncbi:MAG: HIT family hydrolase [Omnitrophica WOR_2 bacterium RIFCSPHIGHO2_02_FULL_67_20]|nr:MAG: HIT family hydrolase [Omnitrophica WOR_2 bacterium RIFCSPHIGHO2_02_FULL_67_20]
MPRTPNPEPRTASADLQRLWAPWRSAFLSQSPAKRRRCIFCAAHRSADDRRHYVVARGVRAFALLNLYPYNNGHIMVVPSRHVGELDDLRPEEWLDMLGLMQRLIRRLRTALHPHGLNIGFNLGRAAGAGIPGHLHVHLVPRWKGDTNFMPLLGQTKVISQSLDELYRLLTRTRR